MSNLRLSLTDKNLIGLPLAHDRPYIARDTDLGGFFVVIGKTSKTFTIQADLHRDDGTRTSIRMAVGEVGEINSRDARIKAKALIGQIGKGEDPRPPRVKRVKPGSVDASGVVITSPDGVPTLGEAWQRFKISHLERKKRASGTLRSYTDHMERLFADWLDRPLSEFGDKPILIADRHDMITKANGPAIANGAMRSFRAVYRHARKTCRKLPAENPVSAVDWNPEHRKDTAMGVADLPAWFEQLALIQNPIRREFHLFLLLSGSRPEVMKKVRIEDLDLKERVLHLKKPKGGEAKAFDIPLSRAMMECIFRLRRIGPIIYPKSGRTFLFPSDAPCGHLVEHKENRAVLSHWGNDLRQTYRTIGQAAEVSEVDMHLLMNHSLPGVNAGYITRSKLMRDHLRKQQEKLSQFILGSSVGRGRKPSAELSRWLNSTSRMLVDDLMGDHPDTARLKSGSRAALRKLEVQAARVAVHALPSVLIDAPSRRPAASRAGSERVGP
ncbi:integrase arm-type DNA-binding domain-containing protein [Brevundimonas sp.]|uniref:integrase arm-type DNA-binding domain-containing protein n=1 Tax=Brevundimonas sp. TaxID=1871086 RepID=UPI0017A92F13|nr:integrase arm-type DNA-binding domain-containing protein [Brevundimonas sp.]MBA4806915.1 integrase family protein [Brevundimonas sp.]